MNNKNDINNQLKVNNEVYIENKVNPIRIVLQWKLIRDRKEVSEKESILNTIL